MFYRPLRTCTSQTVIVESDFCGDVDDAGALSMLLYYAKKYGFKMGGVCLNVNTPVSAPAVDALFRARGFEPLPVGVNLPEDVWPSRYLPVMERFLSEEEKKAVRVIPAEEFYRNVLEKAEDNSVTLISLGFFQNLDAAYQAMPELFEKKVRVIIAMGGSFLYDPDYRECNVSYRYAAEAEHFASVYKGKIIWCGWEVGWDAWGDVMEKAEVHDPLIAAFGAFSSFRRESWDPTGVHFAVLGEGEYYRLSQNGNVRFKDGKTIFEEDPNGNSAFIIANTSKQVLGKAISEALLDSVDTVSTKPVYLPTLF